MNVLARNRRAYRQSTTSDGTMAAELKRRAASGATNTSGGSNTPSEPPEGVLVAMMVAQPQDGNPQPRALPQASSGTIPDPEALHVLRRLLAQATAQREYLIRRNEELAKRSVHWFVEDGNGYCQACSLPPSNARHASRGVAA